MADLKPYFRNKSVLLTGHTGFKGSWLTFWLRSMGASVTGCALPSEEESLYNAINGDQYCDSVILDIREQEKLKKLVHQTKPDFIFHLAAQSLVGDSYESPVETYQANVMGTANLLEALKGLESRCAVVIVTTDKVYENNEWIYPYRENDALGGHDPYSSSKACAEIVTDSYRRSFFSPEKYTEHMISIATARAGNVIGGGDWNKDHLVPDIVNALNNRQPVPIRNPHSVRPWQHVLEPLYGYLLLACKLQDSPVDASGAWNFGPQPGETVTVEAFVQRAITIWGHGQYQEKPRSNAVHEAALLRLDSSKSQALLSWLPVFSVDDAIYTTLSWYRNYSDNSATAAELIETDLERFCELTT